MAVIFILGFFLDFIEIAVVVVPIIAPILLADTSANVTAVWLGVMIGVNMQTSFLTPPFGFALFYLRGVAPPEVRTTQIYLGVVPFIFLQLVGLAIVGVFPALVNYLPNRVYLTAETAPPPKNPRLQLCLEEHLFAQYDTPSRIASSRASRPPETPRSELSARPPPPRLRREPRRRGRDLRACRQGARGGSPRSTRPAAVLQAGPSRGARPAGRISAGWTRRAEGRSKAQARRGTAATGRIREPLLPPLRAEIDSLVRERQALGARIPSDWKETEKRFRTLLTDAERRARLAYRRNVDGAYEAVSDAAGPWLDDTARLAALEGAVVGLRSAIAERGAQASDGGDPHGRAQYRQDRRRRPDPQQALPRPPRTPPPHPRPGEGDARLRSGGRNIPRRTRLAVARRRRSSRPGLAAYDLAIRDTIGVRQQDRLTGEQASRAIRLPRQPPRHLAQILRLRTEPMLRRWAGIRRQPSVEPRISTGRNLTL